MPAALWPSTEQKNVYVPGWRSTVALVLPPVTSSVPSPLTPLPSIFTSCGSEESFVNSIVTEPAVASTEVCSNLSAPLGSAEIWTVDPPRDARDQPLPYPVSLIEQTKQRGFVGLALDYRGVTDELLAAASKAEILIDVWTLNDTALLADWGARDVRWIETDHPELAP